MLAPDGRWIDPDEQHAHDAAKQRATNEQLFKMWESQDRMERMSLDHFNAELRGWLTPDRPYHWKGLS